MIWIGPKHSDLLFSRHFFDKSITLCGEETVTNTSFCNTTPVRQNYNAAAFNPEAFIKQALEQEYQTCQQFMLYNQMHAYYYAPNIRERCVCVNEHALLSSLECKADTRMWASQYIPVVPFEEKLGKAIYDTPRQSGLVLQLSRSAGGYGTFLLKAGSLAEASLLEEKVYMVSQYYACSVPVSVHVIVYDDSVLLMPPSIQIIQNYAKRMLYVGGDYAAFSNINESLKRKVADYSLRLAEQLQKKGYRGIAGFDFLLLPDAAMLLEINARFQASSFMLDRLLQKRGLPTLYELNLQAFKHGTSPVDTLFYEKLTCSSLAYIEGLHLNGVLAYERGSIPEENLFWDGYRTAELAEESAYLFRQVFDTNICHVSQDFKVILHPNLNVHREEFRHRIENKDLLALKVALLNQGVCFSQQAMEYLAGTTQLRKGTHSAIDITLGGQLIVNCPVNGKFSSYSPFCLHFESRWFLQYNSQTLMAVTVETETEPDKKTSTGTPYSNCSFFATDRVRIHHVAACLYKREGKGCLFCDAPASPKRYTDHDLEEIIQHYSNRPDVRHFLIGGGSASDDYETENILRIAQIIRAHSPKDIYVMSLPPVDTSALQSYKDAGVTEVAFNIEVFDRQRALDLMPGKGEIPLSQYTKALREATKLWGTNGRVRSILVAGLETRTSLIAGIGMLCEMGVQPILSPFRPVPGTPMADAVPPDTVWLEDLYQEVQQICAGYKLSLGPDCLACQNNTLSFALQTTVTTCTSHCNNSC